MKILIDALKGNETERVPFWYMRQAGRYLPEFAKLRKNGFLNMLLQPEIMESVSKLPLKYFDPDGIILFSDLLIPLMKTGNMVDYENGLRISENEGAASIYDRVVLSTSRTLNILKKSEKTIIGFIGGPFTVASYFFDGRTVGYPVTKRILASGDMPGFVEKITDSIVDYARVQVEAGAEVIQIFDSWIGSLSSVLFKRYLYEVEHDFVDRIKRLGRPVIFFAEGASHLYSLIAELNYDCISIDWRMTLEQYSGVDRTRTIQGNLDPYLIGSKMDYLIGETERILREGRKFPNHVFNLGHGVPQYAEVSKLVQISETVRRFKR